MKARERERERERERKENIYIKKISKKEKKMEIKEKF